MFDLPPPPLPPPAIVKKAIIESPKIIEPPKIIETPKLPSWAVAWMMRDKNKVEHRDTDYYRLIETIKRINNNSCSEGCNCE